MFEDFWGVFRWISSILGPKSLVVYMVVFLHLFFSLKYIYNSPSQYDLSLHVKAFGLFINEFDRL